MSRESASSRPGASTRDAFWETITAGRTATREDHLLRSVRVPLADRRGVRLRSGRGRPRPPGDTTAWTATSSSRSPPAMEAMRDSGLDLETRRPRADGRHARHRGRRDDVPRGRLHRRLQQGRGVARRPGVRAAVPLPGAHAEQPCERGGAEVRRPRAEHGHLHRVHVRHRRDRLRPPADPGRRGRHRHRRRVGVGHLAHLDGLLRPDQGDVAPQRRRPSRRRGRSTATATASSWARAARS